MQEWVAAKDAFAVWTGLDHDALQVLVSIPLVVGASMILRRPFGNPVPWLAVLAAGIVNEAAAGFADGSFATAELVQSRDDLLLLMTVPTLLLLLARFAPHRFVPARPDRGIPVPIARQNRTTIIDAEYEEIR